MAAAVSRRAFLKILAAAPLLGVPAALSAPADAAGRIARLIAQSRDLPAARSGVAGRMDFISRALMGARYEANTLIGSRTRQEQMVVRDDAFDCVTFCEVVLAAALARDYPGFERLLRDIRYAHGRVSWADRNHYFAEWIRHAIEKKICVEVPIATTQVLRKTVDWPQLGRRQVSIAAIPPATLAADRTLLSTGDIIGFVSPRSKLDFFHTGLLIVPPDGDLVLRHASQRRRAVAQEPLARFVTANRVQHVTLLRAVDTGPH